MDDEHIPEFDNLYLDMNGIIHNCSHPSKDVSFRISEKEIFVNIFNYLEMLFIKIKPRKLFFLAVDGVAPRAKMNQQRARRFRTANEVAVEIEEAEKRGAPLPKEPAFDSNCITPGTVFMDKLHQQLKYFLVKKVNESQVWRDVQIILSGHDVPGEGEHKIMEYIRIEKAQPNYNPNTRHCLYGLDADLMMLGLASHEPHLSLLREEVNFGLRSTKSTSASDSFFLLHLSLFRDYLDLEFQSLKHVLSFEYSLERVIDDYIVLGLFVGNDFLPHLPGFHIKDGAFDLIFNYYKDVLPQLDGYLNNHGNIVLHRLEKLLGRLGEKETEIFSQVWNSTFENQEKISAKVTQYVPESSNPIPWWFEKAKQFALNPGIEDECRIVVSSHQIPQLKKLAKDLDLMHELDHDIDEGFGFKAFSFKRPEKEQSVRLGHLDDAVSHLKKVLQTFEELFDSSDSEVIDSSDFNNLNVSSTFKEAIMQWKLDYYKTKFDFPRKKEDLRSEVVYEYIKGLQWVLFYYLQGVKDWGWFYPYHYAPKITDIVNVTEFAFHFDLGKPFRPIEQLLGVLPPASKDLIPEPLQYLMLDSHSPIKDFYPQQFEIDTHESSSHWEAIIKIPFIEEERLLEAIQKRYKRLTEEEWKRNAFGNMLTFEYKVDGEPEYYASPLPDEFANLPNCLVNVSSYKFADLPKGGLVLGIHPKARREADLLPGFPSIHTMTHAARLEDHGVHVHKKDSKNASIVISIDKDAHFSSQMPFDELAKELIGNLVYVGWPFLSEARVLRISNSDMTYDGIQHQETFRLKPIYHDEAATSRFFENSQGIKASYNRNQAVLIHSVDILVYVQLVTGLDLHHDGSMCKRFSKELSPYAVQTILLGRKYEDPRLVVQKAPPLQSDFPIGTLAFAVYPQAYGTKCSVAGYEDDQFVTVMAWQYNDPTRPQQPTVSKSLAQEEARSRYYPMAVVAKKIKYPPAVVSRVTSSIHVDAGKEKFDLGLNLKFNGKGLKVPGYTRKRVLDSAWEISQKGLDLIQEFSMAFPELFECLKRQNSKVAYSFNDIFPDLKDKKEKAMKKCHIIRKWIEARLSAVNLCSVDLDILSKHTIRRIEHGIKTYSSKSKDGAFQNPKRATRGFLLKPLQVKYRLNHQVFSLGDRILYVADEGTFPPGVYGTVVGKDQNQLHILFDDEMNSLTDLNGFCSARRGSIVHPYSCLNLTCPQPPPSLKTTFATIPPGKSQAATIISSLQKRK